MRIQHGHLLFGLARLLLLVIIMLTYHRQVYPKVHT